MTRIGRPRAFGQFLIGTAVWLALAGCAVNPATTVREPSPAVERVQLAVSPEPPEFRFGGFAHGKLRGGALVGGAAALSCGAALTQGSCSGAMCGALEQALLGACVVVGGIGVGTGFVIAPGARQVAETERVLKARTPADLPQAWDRAVRKALARDGMTVVEAPDRATHRLEISLRRVGTRGSGVNGPVQFYVQAQARLLDARDGHELRARDIEAEGGARPILNWAQDDGKPWAAALDAAIAPLAAESVEAMLHRYPFPGTALHWDTAQGLDAIRPRGLAHIRADQPFARWLAWPKVADCQPALAWEAFPRDADRQAAPDAMARVREVRYDLRIAREENGVPAGVVYAREGLSEPGHAPETPLPAHARFFWSVRASFTLDGRRFVTPWSAFGPATAVESAAPSRQAYRFRTP